MVVVSSDELAQQLRSMKRLPKQLTIVRNRNPNDEQSSGVRRGYAVVAIVLEGRKVCVAYETLRGLMERVSGQSVTLRATEKGLRIMYEDGMFYLRDLADYTPSEVIQIGA